MKLITEGTYRLEKFTGKGGWTYIKLPGELIKSGKAFGMMKISGEIDAYSFEGKHLLPMGNGYVFLPVAKPVRKILGKEEGDEVEIRFYQDELPDGIPDELIDCLKDDPGKLELFHQLAQEDKETWISYIYSAEDIEAKSNRIIKLLNSLS